MPLDTDVNTWSTLRMTLGAEQLKGWIARSHFTQREAAAHFEWDETFISHLVSGRRIPALTNAITIQRKTGIPVEAWVSSPLDSRDPAARGAGRKRKYDKA